jgi:hypothetical protein
MFIFLALALTIPAVTVDARLNGFPTATTHSPPMVSLSPNSIKKDFFHQSLEC